MAVEEISGDEQAQAEWAEPSTTSGELATAAGRITLGCDVISPDLSQSDAFSAQEWSCEHAKGPRQSRYLHSVIFVS